MLDFIVTPFQRAKIGGTTGSRQVSLRKRLLGSASFDRFTWLPMRILNGDWSAEKRDEAARALASFNLIIAGRNLSRDGSDPEIAASAQQDGDG